MTPRYLSESAKAESFLAEGRALEAALAWGRAARSAPNRAARLELLCGMRSSVELALHQAIYEAKEDGCSWRMLGRYTDMSWQTLHRRYRAKPLRMPPPPEPDAFPLRGKQVLIVDTWSDWGS
ncbi:MAG: hypothetical protein ACRD0Z_10055 [Acidimicrobiales bacterium]